MPLAEKFTIATSESLEHLGEQLAASPMGQQRLWLLRGPLGAGKTTFVKGLAKGYGVRAAITSPTFAVLRAFPIPSSKRIFVHADLYRIKHQNELPAIGLHDALQDKRAVLAVEWPDAFMPLFASRDHVIVRIALLPRARRITVRLCVVKQDSVTVRARNSVRRHPRQ